MPVQNRSQIPSAGANLHGAGRLSTPLTVRIKTVKIKIHRVPHRGTSCTYKISICVYFHAVRQNATYIFTQSVRIQCINFAQSIGTRRVKIFCVLYADITLPDGSGVTGSDTILAQFKYTAVKRGGARVSGTIQALNELDAAARIKEECDVIIKLKEVKTHSGGSFLSMDIGGKRFHAQPFSVVCSQFAIILKAGIPVARAVRLVAGKTADKPLKQLLNQVAQDVENGRKLSVSFEERGKKFLPVTFVETIRAGEEAGNVSEAFESMHVHFDKQTKMRRRLRDAMIYPVFVLILAVLVVAALMIWVVPMFNSLFESYSTSLPAVTRTLIAISAFFQHFLVLCLLWIYSRTENGRMFFARLHLKLPVIGNIQELTGASQFANTMTSLLSAGLPLNKAVSITAHVMDNYFLSTQTAKLSDRVLEGHPLGESMRQQNIMPEILIDMTAVGENSGEMTQALKNVGRYYDDELENAVQNIFAKLQPSLIIVMAGIAGFVIISVYSAMFSLYSSM